VFNIEIRQMTGPGRSIVVFDLGGVLIKWDPRHLYRKLFVGDVAAMEDFLANVCTHEWNRGQDAGRSFAEGARLLKAEHPDKAELVRNRLSVMLGWIWSYFTFDVGVRLITETRADLPTRRYPSQA
jgi:hypothetical protein